MITAKPLSAKYQTQISSNVSQTIADVAADKGGSGNGFRPHDFLAAALASCISITLRMAADKQGFDLGDCSVSVELNRDDPSVVRFEYQISYDSSLNESQRKYLAFAAAACPVKSTLSRKIEFASQSK